MTEEEMYKHEERCNRLARQAVKWITVQLQGTRGTGYRGTTELEGGIYAWLMNHAMFD